MSNLRQRGMQCGKSECKNKIRVLDEKIQCERCKSQFHLDCSGFNIEAYNILTADDSINEIIWCCSVCRPKVRNLLDCIDEIENKLKNVDEKIEEIQSNFERRFESIENKLNQNECKINEDMEDKIKSIKMNFTENNQSNKENL